MNFLELEGGNLAIAAFSLVVTAFVATRPFVGKNAFKIWFPTVFLAWAFYIGTHYYMTTSRIQTVETRFLDNKPIICESRAQRKVAQSIIILKKLGWSLNNNILSNPEYERVFHTARCLEHFDREFPE
ncbi:MAG: hypothetical protein WC141_07965 [Arcobacteraceae bacterium]